jgi:phage anti-repressor protein
MNTLIKQETVNFNTLVTTNSTQSLNFQSKLIDELNTTFTENEQKWYVANLYMYLNYHPTNDFPINLDDVYKMIGFAHKKNAKRTLVNNFIENEDYNITVLPREHGKFSDETIMLNVDTFKNICMMTKTDKAKEIRKYYVRLENIYNKLINDEHKQHQLELQEKESKLIQQEEETQQLLKNMTHQQKIDKHDYLIEKFNNKKCVYIAEITHELIKIGSSKDIKERCKGLSSEFGNCIFLDIFEHNDYIKVESNILVNVKPYLYKLPVNGNISKEIVKLTDDFNYSQLHNIVKQHMNITEFLSPKELFEYRKLEVESKKLDFMNTLIKNGESIDSIIQLLKVNSSLNLEKEEVKEEVKEEDNENNGNKTVLMSRQLLNTPVLFKAKKPRGQKILKIDPNNLNIIIKTYDSMSYLLRSDECKCFSKSSIQTAIKDARIYKGFRWNFIDKETKPTNHYKSNSPIRETILKLNETKDTILESYISKDEIAKIYKIGKLKMTNIIRNEEKYDNCYFIEYSKCPHNIIEKYDKPIMGISSVNAKRIKQINPVTKTEIIFNSLIEIYIKYGYASKTIINVIENKLIYGGCLWEYI